ncbi:hypothetical protein GUITHDRAFT_156143 [Guillardia theta CCMP2712]|uniref:PPM-type phosphatase domain-containing protein n=2 Tax=Guillardia theta TaxID=55529 RepID=L1IAL1_GUITC|nr:hypothetical protein GUITHDRAFT_156143 [Guillardia theta CCMP2712]EKX33147.1 hypothetical protein GUITHDRAFT_156143 [Guillardia theta CCMP2712]|eukprot:XP_005820127.1 hypothetical protein GUITHDRAFT_156143 [Guillardia theta CCMP2712]
MEDMHFTSLNFGTSGKSCFFGVFDGHSGKRASQFARDQLAKYLEVDLQQLGPREALQSAFMKTDASFLQRAEKENLNDGSTAATALLVGRELYVANAGDSRAILCCGQSAIPMSVDHKPDRPSERERIEQAGGTVVYFGCARVNGILATSRGIGDRELKNWVIAEPEIRYKKLEPGDDFLVMATDGLWDVMTNVQVATIISGEKNAQAAAKKLTAEALKLGSMDNITALVVDLREMLADMGPSADEKNG